MRDEAIVPETSNRYPASCCYRYTLSPMGNVLDRLFVFERYAQHTVDDKYRLNGDR